jgi:outer membrane immunogenic protein
MSNFSKLLLGAVSLVALSSAAQSADAVLPEPVVSGYNWSGLYVGAGIGVGAVVHGLNFDIDGTEVVDFNGIGGEGFRGEISIGYDYQISPRFVVGAFADAHYGNIGPELNASPLIDADLENVYGFDVGGRVGYVLNPTTLGYVLGGYAWQHFELDGDFGGTPFDFEEDRDGYVLGVGMETVISGGWTLKGEYRYAYYGDDTVLTIDDVIGDFDGSLGVEPSTHTFTVGANYRFGADEGGPALAAPAYNWTGFYVGGALGAGAVVHDLEIFGGAADFNGIGGEGVFGELNVGYDHDFGTWVAGVMVDGRYSGIESTLEIGGGGPSIDAKADYGFDVLVRAGMKMNETTLAYVIGGYSWQNFEVEGSSGIGTIVEWDSSGFSIGGGLEAAVTDNMTVGIEYRYSQFDGEDFDSGGLFELEPSFHTTRVGVKYKFN